MLCNISPSLTIPSWLILHAFPFSGQVPDYAGFEGAPSALMDRVNAFLAAERYRLREDMNDR